MIEIKGKQETLDLLIEFDKATGLPLYDEQENILNIIKTYLALPYTVAEYGCGKKCSIIIRKLIELGIPPYAIKRGMIMERDMSPEALEEKDFRKRPHALIIDNPLYHPKDFYQDVLLKMLEEKSVNVSIHKQQIHAGDYVLSHNKELQFIMARSHIFPIVNFWDEQIGQTHDFILDPTINPINLLDVEMIREYLNDYEALIFTAPLLGHFRLDIENLTYKQEHEISEIIRPDLLSELDDEEYAAFIRELTGAPAGSIGDPLTWTYANNIYEHDRESFLKQKFETGKGDILDELFDNLITAREKGEGSAVELREQLEAQVASLGIYSKVKVDADQAEEQLAPLAEAELIIAYYRALLQLVAWQRKEKSLHLMMQRDLQLEKVQGISKRLRYRLDRLAKASLDEEQRIDARALNEGFTRATLETINQMNQAGLEVFIDAVGNIHGLLLNVEQKSRIRENINHLQDISSRSICHCSHIDTVKDGGKYDGRLGVLSGIEITHIFYDLQKYFQLPYPHNYTSRALMVSSFVGEEMTFTGEGVSMPGSSAVTGRQFPETIYLMDNDQGETYREKLIEMLYELAEAKADGKVHFFNTLSPSQTPDDLLQSCLDPRLFFTPHTYERHIEQGPVLDTHHIPLVLVDTIMGIYQEDFIFEGYPSESHALDFNLYLRRLSMEERFSELRITVGIMEGMPESSEQISVSMAVRCHLKGEKNHAGATLLKDRRDPGVAAARLAQYFVKLINDHNQAHQTQLKPIIGDIKLLPGTNRNVIPESASLSLGVMGEPLEDEQKELLINQLHAWIIHSLHPRISAGGEGIFGHSLELIDFMSIHKNLRLSVDIRSAHQEKTDRLLHEANEYLHNIAQQADLEINRQVHQTLRPYPLHKSGQVLQIERSYGGSHNPNEAQLDNDLLRGSLLQLHVTEQFLHSDEIHTHLYEMVHTCLPKAWIEALPRFISGALHDTCNMAGKILERSPEQNPS